MIVDMQVTTAPKVGRVKMREYIKMVETLPILVATGAQDRLCPAAVHADEPVNPLIA